MSEPRDEGPEGLEAIRGLARIALSAGWHTGGWAVRTSLRVPVTMLELARSPEKAIDLGREVRHAAPVPTSRPVSDEGRESGGTGQVAGATPTGNGHRPAQRDQVARTLREEGERLLRRSRDVRDEVDAHPAYERILSELAPDEGRILGLLLLDSTTSSGSGSCGSHARRCAIRSATRCSRRSPRS